MAVCCCILAGTAACQHCRNNPFATDVYTNKTVTNISIYTPEIESGYSSKHYTREEAEERLKSIGVMDKNGNLVPPYDKIFVKRKSEI